MGEHTATFEIDSESDARVISRLLDEIYNRLREERRGVHGEDAPDDRMLAEFEALRDAVDRGSGGEVTITYRERADDRESA